MTSQAQSREPVTVERIVAISRELLVTGGPGAVVIREVARQLEVTAPALYRHVAGRDDLITLLIAAINDEAAAVCIVARDAEDPADPVAQLRHATLAFRRWAHENRVEFGLVYGTPLVGYTAPEEGATTLSARRFADIFIEIFFRLTLEGRLRATAREAMSTELWDQMAGFVERTGAPMSPGEAQTLVSAWQRMLGIISVEVAGHVDWLATDTGPFIVHQLEALMTDLVVDPP